ncbi:MAG: energy transducer TonB, partial [Pseudomonadota bacterium]|nr:energy transducer TonB [Pseudomonadota bacterium]
MIKFTKLAALCSLIALPTQALARDVNDLGVDVQAATSAYIVKNSNKRYPGSYNGSRLEGWALMSYVVDTQGKAKDIEVIMASDTRGSEENAEKYLTNLEFAPATKEGKTVEGGYLYSFEVGKYFNGYSNDKASRGFINEYDEINKMLQAKEFNKAEQALAELYKDHTKNTSEQALFAWLKSQYYYHQQQWFDFDEQLSVAYLLRAKL